MGNFRDGNSRGGFGRGNSRGGYGRGGSSGGRSFGGRDGGRGRSFGGFDRGPVEMHDATCSNCGKQCKVPFRPTGSKPVFCSDCFGKQNGGSEGNFSSRGRGESQSAGSSDELKKINAKLDKILTVLGNLEIDVEEDSEEEGDEDSEDDSESD